MKLMNKIILKEYMIFRVKSLFSLSLSLLFTQNIPHLYDVISELK